MACNGVFLSGVTSSGFFEGFKGISGKGVESLLFVGSPCPLDLFCTIVSFYILLSLESSEELLAGRLELFWLELFLFRESGILGFGESELFLMVEPELFLFVGSESLLFWESVFFFVEELELFVCAGSVLFLGSESRVLVLLSSVFVVLLGVGLFASGMSKTLFPPQSGPQAGPKSGWGKISGFFSFGGCSPNWQKTGYFFFCEN